MFSLTDKHALLKGFVFRLIKKRIAGATLDAALQEARKNYNTGMRTTLTFLNDNVDEPAKARYNANTYVQLARQACRLHLNADISLRLSQIGSRLNHGILDKCLADVMRIVDGTDTKVWFEAERGSDMQDFFDTYRRYRREYKNIGIELPLWYQLDVSTIKANLRPKDAVKITAYNFSGLEESLKIGKEKKAGKGRRENRNGNGNGGDVPSSKHVFEKYISNISKLLAAGIDVSVLDSDEKTIVKLAGFSKEYKKDLIFELPLGSNRKWISKLMKMKVRLSVYTPYGKDWEPYMANRWAVRHERLRGLATKVLDIEEKGDGNDGK